VLGCAAVAAALACAPASAAAQGVLPPDCDPPTLTGQARQGAQLHGAADQTCFGLPFPTVTLQWLRCTSPGAGCTAVTAATTASSSDYTAQPADAGRVLTLRQVASNGAPPNDVDEVSTGIVEGPPSASFAVSPSVALPGQAIEFTSTSRDPDGDALSEAWDLDGDGAYDDASGTTVTHAFSTPGSHAVALRVTAGGEQATSFGTAVVAAEGAPGGGGGGSGGGHGGSGAKGGPAMLSPFPVVAIAGRLTHSGARVTLLSVRGPAKARVLVRCHGHGCPVRSMRARIGRSRKLRLRRFERRLRAGTLVEILVTGPGRVGKYARFKVRRGKPPARTDACLAPGSSRPTACPSR
jgi:hypothetical protein